MLNVLFSFWSEARKKGQQRFLKEVCMRRKCIGFVYTCKVCRHEHILDTCIPLTKEFFLPCVYNKYRGDTYVKKDLKFWHGDYWKVFDTRISKTFQ